MHFSYFYKEYFIEWLLVECSCTKPEVQGPLSMYPPAEDNYGTDACAIMCVPASPALLIIVTLDGRIYHCVVLTSDNNAADTTEKVLVIHQMMLSISEPSLSSSYIFGFFLLRIICCIVNEDGQIIILLMVLINK